MKSNPPFENGFSYLLASDFDSNAELQSISFAKSLRIAVVGEFATGRIRGGGPAPQVVNNP